MYTSWLTLRTDKTCFVVALWKMLSTRVVMGAASGGMTLVMEEKLKSPANEGAAFSAAAKKGVDSSSRKKGMLRMVFLLLRRGVGSLEWSQGLLTSCGEEKREKNSYRYIVEKNEK
jgi:hypothetical protein